MSRYNVEVRPALAREIERAAAQSGVPPKKFAEQLLEVACAERRASRFEDERERREAASKAPRDA